MTRKWPEVDPQASSSATAPAEQALANAEAERNLETQMQRIIAWTLWTLLAAVLIGTVVGVVLVSIPLQKGDPPAAVRKSAAFVVLHRSVHDEENAGSRLLGDRRALLGRENANATSKVLVWSGKGHASNMVFDDLHIFDLRTKRWQTVFNLSAEQGRQRHYPVPRWKAVTLYEAKSNDMIVFGGDPLGVAGLEGVYLNDLWRLKVPSEFAEPVWRSVSVLGRGSGDDSWRAVPSRALLEEREGALAENRDGLPEARRAHAGVILDVDGASTLVVHGGRNKAGDLLADVWATSLDADKAQWRCLSGCKPPADLSTDAGLARKHKKKHEKEGPPERKGHAAVAIPDNVHPKLVILGGRNSTAYFSDMWVFDLATEEWEQVAVQGRSAPSGRDHLNGFYLNGNIYIYGGRDPAPQGDVWAFNVSSQQWTEVAVQGETPAPRFLYSMDTFSPGGNASDMRMVVFGGETHGGCYLDDVWEFSVAEAKWTQKSAPLPDGRKKKCSELLDHE